MTPAEREAYSGKLKQYRDMAPEERQNLQMAWGRMSETVRGAWRNYMLSLDAGERDRLHREMQEVPYEERTRWRIELLVKAGLITDEAAGGLPAKD